MDTRGVMAGYSVDTRDMNTGSHYSGATDQLNSAAVASNTATSGSHQAMTRDQALSADNADRSSRANVQLPIRNL